MPSAMREIVIDVTRLAGRLRQGRLPTGVDRVSLDYIRHFSGRATAQIRWGGRWLELSDTASDRVFQTLLSPGRDASERIARAVLAAYACGWKSPSHGAGRFLFNTGHSGLEKPDYAHRIEQSHLRPVFFVHDLIPITHPEYCRAGERERHQRRMDTILQVGQGVIANSQATLDELANYAARQKKSLPPSAVAWLVSPDLPPPQPDRPLPGPYFVILGTIEARKNHWFLLQVWKRLIETMGTAAPRLVIVGQRGWECENVVDLLERADQLNDFVIERSDCSDGELSTYLRHAQALLFPSHAEGFGLPLVEAMAQGVPVIASDLPAFREIAGGIPDYLDPIDGLGWLARIAAYANPTSPARIQQLSRLKGFTPPNMAGHFREVETLLDRLRHG